MASFYELEKQYEITEPDAIRKFRVALVRQISYFDNGETNRRSWAQKQDDGSYRVRLGDIERVYSIPTEDGVKEFYRAAAEQLAHGDKEFLNRIEKATRSKPKKA